MFSANVRLPGEISTIERAARVKKVIEDLGLESCADTKVGTESTRGISGGERKRTCIGMELVLAPKILFLDEPTTGESFFSGRFFTYNSIRIDIQDLMHLQLEM